jgi:Domain of unknown function (DUF4328)
VDVNPDQAPTAAPESPAFGSHEHHYVDQGGRVDLLTGLLAAGAILSVVASVSTWLEIDLLERASRGAFDIAEAEANDSRQLLIGLSDTGLYLVTVVIFAMFLVRANKNAHALSGEPLEVVPSWMVWWFVVPFANLYKPYVAVREVWERSKGAAPTLLGLWWAAWISGNILGQISWRMSDPEDSIPEMVSADQFVLAGEAVGVATALLALWMVRSLHAGQQHHHRTGKPDLSGQ